MKNKAIIICALLLACGISAMAQKPFKDLTKKEPVVNIKSPTIVDFVSSYLSETDDELRGNLANEWRKFLRNEPLGKGVNFMVDMKNGYIRYDMDYDLAYPDEPSGEKTCVEFCYWNCDDNKHKLFAENVSFSQNGKPMFTEFSGMYIYAYDNATQNLYMVDQDQLGIDEDVHGEVTFVLPRKGKDIEVLFNNAKKTQKKLVWNGKGFKLSK